MLRSCSRRKMGGCKIVSMPLIYVATIERVTLVIRVDLSILERRRRIGHIDVARLGRVCIQTHLLGCCSNVWLRWLWHSAWWWQWQASQARDLFTGWEERRARGRRWRVIRKHEGAVESGDLLLYHFACIAVAVGDVFARWCGVVVEGRG